MEGVYDKLMQCYERVRKQTNFKLETVLVLGSGLGDFAEQINVQSVVDCHDIKDFSASTVAGHA